MLGRRRYCVVKAEGIRHPEVPDSPRAHPQRKEGVALYRSPPSIRSPGVGVVWGKKVRCFDSKLLFHYYQSHQ